MPLAMKVYQTAADGKKRWAAAPHASSCGGNSDCRWLQR